VGLNEPETNDEKKALQKLDEGTAHEAFQLLRPLIDYPGQVDENTRWTSVWTTFAKIAEAIAGHEFASLVQNVAKKPDDPELLYRFGYELIEEHLEAVAATVLKRAFEHAPDSIEIVSEYVCALEGIGRNDEACRVLALLPATQSHFFLKYLHAFNTLMSGEWRESIAMGDALNKLLHGEEGEHRDDFEMMMKNLSRMHERAERLSSLCDLSSGDLRGWNGVVNGSVLLHLSPYGGDDGMNGRYAMVQEGTELLGEAIFRMNTLLRSIERLPDHILFLPDRDSEILATIWGLSIGCPVEPYSPQSVTDRTVIVCYTPHDMNHEVLAGLSEESGGIFWCHAVNWTHSTPVAPDVISYFYQYTTPPWGDHFRINPETDEIENVPARDGSAATIAEELYREMETEFRPGDQELLTELWKRLTELKIKDPAHRRERFLADSPVKSSRFS